MAARIGNGAQIRHLWVGLDEVVEGTDEAQEVIVADGLADGHGNGALHPLSHGPDVLLRLGHQRRRHAALDERVGGEEGHLVRQRGLLEGRLRKEGLKVVKEVHVGLFILQLLGRVPLQHFAKGAKIGFSVLDCLRLHADARSWSVKPGKNPGMEAFSRTERTHDLIRLLSRLKQPEG